jgi:glyoxylase-like metal-dependent hydrolase (beta-lactamase superfamily II)
MQAYSLGSITIHKVTEFAHLPTPLAASLPGVTAQDLIAARAWLQDPFLGEDLAAAQLALSMHSFVVQSGGRNILIDTCLGNHKPRQPLDFAANLDRPDYLDNLARAGLRPEDIDYVLCTHLHFDHIGWNTRLQDGHWVPTFPNARYLFSREDYEDLLVNREAVPLFGRAFEDSVLPVVAAGQAEFVDDGHALDLELGRGVWFERAPGHSAGNCVIHARCGDARAVFCGDVIHHPLQVMRPELCVVPGDAEPELAARTRRRLIEACADTDTVLMPAHFLDPTAGRVASTQDGFRYNYVAAP